MSVIVEPSVTFLDLTSATPSESTMADQCKTKVPVVAGVTRVTLSWYELLEVVDLDKEVETLWLGKETVI